MRFPANELIRVSFLSSLWFAFCWGDFFSEWWCWLPWFCASCGDIWNLSDVKGMWIRGDFSTGSHPGERGVLGGIAVLQPVGRDCRFVSDDLFLPGTVGRSCQANLFSPLYNRYRSGGANFQAAQVMDWGASRRAQTRVATIARHVSPALCSASNPFMQVSNPVNDDGGIQIKGDVRDALERGLPVVALESTIISHGMPYPQNFETAKEVEAIVRESGAVPATIAILDGVPCIGLEEGELQKLAQLGKRAVKTSRRDIAHVIGKKTTGATTVSATMFFAAKVGISVFVTGGIGGVHREGEATMDVSSDLTELGRTAVTVVCAGVKSILDIPRTLEYLETQGVTVIGYGTDEFPAFFTPRSGCKAPSRVNTPEECAAITAANLSMGLQSGILVGVPIPARYAAAAEPVEAAIQTSLKELKEKNISGAAVTPYVLKRVNELTGGASLAANIALIKNNARIGSQIAIATAGLVEGS